MAYFRLQRMLRLTWRFKWGLRWRGVGGSGLMLTEWPPLFETIPINHCWLRTAR